MARLAALVFALAVLAAACKRPTKPDASSGLPHAILPAVGDHLPTAFPYADFVGAEACKECHRNEYDGWTRSPHGRSMVPASVESVLADFDAPPLAVADGTVTFSHGPDGFFMEMTAQGGKEKRRVDLALASGRQHQLYAVRSADGTTSILPAVWSTRAKTWLPLSLYQPTELAPSARNYWGTRDMLIGCASCHVSQAHRAVKGGTVASAVVDLSINCESCHGPGREHVERRRAGRTDDVYRDLRTLSSVEESRVCGQCHGFQLKRYVFPPAADGLPQIFVTSLINDALRPDGTQHLTSYQYPGHVLTAGFARNQLRCNDCHGPHGLEARRTSSARRVATPSSWHRPASLRTRTTRPKPAVSTATWPTRGSATTRRATSARATTRSPFLTPRRRSTSARRTRATPAIPTSRRSGRSPH
jgi:hypothetical protein